MHMQMVHRLPAIRARVDHNTIAAREAFVAGNFGGGFKQGAEERGVAGGGVVKRGDVPARNDENVDRGLGVDVGKGEKILILVNRPGGNLTGGDFAKETIHMRPL